MTKNLENDENEYCFSLEEKLKDLQDMRKRQRIVKALGCGVVTLLLASTCYVFATTNDFGTQYISAILSVYSGFALAIIFSQFKELLKASDSEKYYKSMLEIYLAKDKKEISTKEESNEMSR